MFSPGGTVAPTRSPVLKPLTDFVHVRKLCGLPCSLTRVRQKELFGDLPTPVLVGSLVRPIGRRRHLVLPLLSTALRVDRANTVPFAYFKAVIETTLEIYSQVFLTFRTETLIPPSLVNNLRTIIPSVFLWLFILYQETHSL